MKNFESICFQQIILENAFLNLGDLEVNDQNSVIVNNKV